MQLALLRRLSSRAAPCALDVSGGYLTDGRRLFRVVSRFAADAEHVFASLEDCVTLEVQAYAPGDLYEMRLRPVRIAE
jgi:hypothetical protein